MPLELVGAAEVAEMFGVTRQRLHAIINANPETFPAPLADLKAGSIWNKKHVETWAKKHRPPKR